MSQKLLIIDGHSLAYRMFYALPTTMSLKGKPINAVYGFTTLLFKALDIFKPDSLAICFDRKEPTFRHQLYKEYKGTRPPAPAEFINQLPLLKEIITELNLTFFELAGFEADDLIGTLTFEAEKQNIENLVLTADKDNFQLISDKTKIILPSKGITEFNIMDKDTLQKKYSLTPSQIIDFKALEGDQSDNIPGVPGIGEKTATKLLLELHSLNEIYANLDKISSKSLKDKLSENKNLAFLSYDLATINRNVPFTIDFAKLKFIPDWNKMVSTFKRFEFKSLISKYSTNTEKITETQAPCGQYNLVTDLNILKELLPRLKNGFAFDLETTKKQPVGARLVGISLSFIEGQAYYVSLNDYLSQKKVEENNAQLFNFLPTSKENSPIFKSNPFLTLLKPLLENEKIPKFTHNGKFDDVVLKNYGIILKGIKFDSMIAAYLLFPGEKIGLKNLVQRFFNIELITYKELTQNAKINFSDIPPEQACLYASADADFTLRLTSLFRPLIEEKGLNKLFYEIELPLQTVLAKMEFFGVMINFSYLHQLNNIFSEETKELTKQIFALAGCEFNLNSPKQLSEILFTKLNIPTQKRTKEGFSTNAQVLEKLAPKYEIANIIMRYRTLEKLQTTYIKALPLLINPYTKKIHTSFNQTITITGRLSSSNPNLQNIPIRSPEGEKIRAAFIGSSQGNIILSADYSQIELRLLAHLSQDENMIQAFKNGKDIHSSTAATIFNIPVSEVTKEHRHIAKTVNFGISYGMSAYGLSETLGIPTNEADNFIKSYFLKFPKIKEFMNKTIEMVQKNGFVKTEFGRWRNIPDILSPNGAKRQFAERVAINTRVQGTSADIIKMAMITIQNKLEKESFKSHMIIQVHDELVFDVFPEEKEKLISLVKKEMEHVVSLAVPLVVNLETGPNWQEIS